MPPSNRALAFRLGAFVLVVAVLLAVLAVLVTSTPTWFRTGTRYTIRFTDAPGVGPDTPVRRSGVRVGEVRSVRLDDNRGDVAVVVNIEPGFTVRYSERPTLVTGILGNDVSIDFLPVVPEKGEKAPPPDPVPPGSELQGFRQATVNTLLNRATEVVPTTQETLDAMRKSLQSLDRLQPQVEKTLEEYRLLAREARPVIPELRQTNKQLQQAIPLAERTLEEYRLLATEGRQTNKQLQQLIPTADDTMKELRAASKEVREAVPDFRKAAREIELTGKDVRTALPDFRNAVNDFGDASRQVRRTTERIDLLIAGNEKALTETINRLPRLAERIDEAVQRVNLVLGETNRKNLERTLDNVAKGTDRLDAIAASADDILNQGRTSVRRLNDTLKEAEELFRDLRRTTGPLGERGPSITRNLDETLIKLNATLTDLQAIVKAVGESDGTFMKVITDPSLYNRLDEFACQLAKAAPRIDRILRDVETFADKIARHPESLGVGGAVRPGSGVKETPPGPVPPLVPAPGVPIHP